MAGVKPYWRKDPDRTVPFSALSLVETYYHPEVRHEAYPSLISRARKHRADDGDFQRFKQDLIALLAGDREGLHPQALTQADCYDEEDDTAFLLRLWSDLYPSEGPPRRGESPEGERVV